METDITTRIEQLLSEFGLAPSAFADGIQIPRAVMSHILSRRNKPSLEVVQKILKKFPQVNSDWLLNGLGSMIQLNIFEDLENPTTPTLQTTNLPPVRDNIFIAPALLEQDIAPVVSPPTVAPLVAAENIVHSKIPQNSETNIKANVENVVADNQLVNVQPTALPDFSKKIEKIIFFYSDKTFSVHLPE